MTTKSYPPRVLDHLHILLSKLVWVELEEPLRYLWQRGEFGFFVDVLLTIFVFKEALKKIEQSQNELKKKQKTVCLSNEI